MKPLLTISFLFVIVSLAKGQTFTSSNLPIVKINTGGTEIPMDPKITADMQVIYNGVDVRNNVSDPANHYNGKIGIEIRGDSTSTKKNQYSLQFRDNLGNQKRFAFLGMPREEDWVLIGPFNDKSLMRDVLAYKLGRDLGRYSPRTRYCEVILNGNYIGIYVVTENIKRDTYRVDVDELSATEITGDNLTGGYILKIDKSSGVAGSDFASEFFPDNRSDNQKIQFQFDYPKYDVIVPAQKNYIQNFVHSFEAALDGPNYSSTTEGFRKYIDESSFIDFMIMQEVTKNVEGYRLGSYLYKQKDSNGGKLFMGPIWDFNQGFGNANYCTSGAIPGFVYDFNTVCNDPEWLVPFWWKKLLTDDRFSNRLGGKWYNLRNDKFQTSVIHEFIDSVATALDESQARNFEKWNILGDYVWPNYYVGDTFEEEVTWLKNWVSERMIWLDENFPPFDPTAVSDDEFKVSFNSYPNPFKEEIIIQYMADKPTTVGVEILDMLGRKVLSMDHTFDHKESHRLQFNETAVEPGVYLLRLTQQGQHVYTSKVIKR